MERQKKRTIGLIVSIAALVASVAAFICILFLSVLNTDGVPSGFFGLLNKLITYLQSGAVGRDDFDDFSNAAIATLVFLVTFIVGLIFMIKSIVDLANYKKEGNDKKALFDSLKLSYTLALFFGLLMFLRYFREVGEYSDDYFRVLDVGAYVGMGLGGFGVLLSAANYFMLSEKPLISKILRAALAVVGFAASVLVLAPTVILDEELVAAPMSGFLLIMNDLGNDESDLRIAASLLTMFDFLLLAFVFANVVGCNGVDERAKKNGKEAKGKNIVSIVLSAVAVLLVAGALFVAPSIDTTQIIVLTGYSYVAFVLVALMLVLAIAILVLDKSKKEKPLEAAISESRV